ncbi:hypothetical protein LIER_43396 [Lithospermum erythrorhizon]|uniref:Uncharacterized protein n=1 Tax=Lithospermum erythrorhizon TaxID=34254 RepID=A0AAV3PZC9_LITER
MGQGEEVKKRSDPVIEIQERGEIFFFYRPKVEKEEAHNPDEVQKLYIVLRPESGEKTVQVKQDSHSGKEGAKSTNNSKYNEESSNNEDKHSEKEGGKSDNNFKNEGGQGTDEVNSEKQPLLRFIVMGKKSLPDPSKRSRPFWGFVELVTTKIDDIKDALKGEEYDTATRGHRHNPPARALGEGVYRILRHVKGRNKHTHLIYKLEFPPEDEKNEVQESLNVEREGSFIIQIKNPSQHGSGFRGQQSKRKALFPAKLQGKLGNKRFHPADPPDFLNYEGCEFLLISASDDIEEELGVELKNKTEDAHDVSCSDLVNTFGETASVRPLLYGTWA